jgi:hypothetical protein
VSSGGVVEELVQIERDVRAVETEVARVVIVVVDGDMNLRGIRVDG